MKIGVTIKLTQKFHSHILSAYKTYNLLNYMLYIDDTINKDRWCDVTQRASNNVKFNNTNIRTHSCQSRNSRVKRITHKLNAYHNFVLT
jgi:ribonuclease HI